MRLKFIVVGFVLLFSSGYAEAQSLVLANFLNSQNPPHYPVARQSLVDRNGYSIVMGVFRDTVSLGHFHLVAPGGGISGFLERIDPFGNAVWAETSSSDTLGSMALDSLGNVDFVGSFFGNLHFGNFTVSNSTPTAGVYLAQCDSNGTFVWARSFINDDVPGSFAVDSAGDLYIYCGLTNTATLDSVTVVGVPSTHTNMLMKVSRTGGAVWGRTLEIQNNFGVQSISAAKNGELAIVAQVGRSGATIDFVSYPPSSSVAPAVLNLYSSGTTAWGEEFTGSGTASGATTDQMGDVFVTGTFSGTLHVGPLTLVESRSPNLSFLTKLDKRGKPLWAEIVGDSLPAGYLQSDGDGNLFYSASYTGLQHIGQFISNFPGGSGFALIKFDVNGSPIWVATTGAKMDGVDGNGNSYLFGSYGYNLDTVVDRLLNFPSIQDTFSPYWLKINDQKLETDSPGNPIYCAGDTMLVSYSSNSPFLLLNQFEVQLSDSTGSFSGSNTQIIGKLFSHASTGEIPAALPITLAAGSDYKIRVISTHPVLQDIEFGPVFSVRPRIALSIDARKGTSVCEGGSVSLEAVGKGYCHWTSDADSTLSDTAQLIEASKTGMYYVAMIDTGGCQVIDSVMVTILPLPKATLSISGDTSICEGEKLSVTVVGGKYYLWNTLDSLPTISIATAGAYSVMVRSDSGCEVTLGPFNVMVLPTPNTPSIDVRGDTLVSSSNFNNQWYLGGKLLIGDTNQILIATASGDYTVEISNQDGCSAVSNGVQVGPTSVREQAKTQLKDLTLSPNPTMGVATLQYALGAPGVVRIEILDVLGRKVLVLKDGTQDAGMHQFAISIGQDHPAGSYYLRIVVAGCVTTKRLVLLR